MTVLPTDAPAVPAVASVPGGPPDGEPAPRAGATAQDGTSQGEARLPEDAGTTSEAAEPGPGDDTAPTGAGDVAPAAAGEVPAPGDDSAAEADGHPRPSPRRGGRAATTPGSARTQPEGGARGHSRGDAPPRRGGARPATPRGFPRADRPGNVPAPEHHHLPGWVRRAYARSRPPLADLLGLLQGNERAQLQKRVEELTAGISAGRFSLAWQYPDVIEEGRVLYEGQRSRVAEVQRAGRALDTARRRASERIRDAGDALPAEATARLTRALRSASDLETVAQVQAEADRVLSTSRSASSKRRDREIERTRARILRTLPRGAADAAEPSESWQDVLRRFAEEQQAADG